MVTMTSDLFETLDWLTKTQFRILMLILRNMDDNNELLISRKYICEKLGCTKATAINNVKVLVELGLIEEWRSNRGFYTRVNKDIIARGLTHADEIEMKKAS